MSKEYTETVEKVLEAFPDLEDTEEKKKLLAFGEAIAADTLKDKREELDEIIEETNESVDELVEQVGDQ